MKVLVISAAFPPMRAGEADHAFHLCRNLAGRGLDVHVLTTKTNIATSDLPIKIHRIMQNWSWRELPRFVSFLKHSSPHAILLIYIGWIYNDHPMITFAPTISKACLPSVPFVTQFENTTGTLPHNCSIPTRLVRKGVKLWAGPQDVAYEFGSLLRDSERVIILSETHRAILTKHYAAVHGKAYLIPPPPIIHMCPENNGVTRQRGREALNVKPDEFVILYFGYIYPPKGIETLLKAFRIVSNQRRHLRLVIIGGIIARKHPDHPSYAEDLAELARRLGIEKKVTWTGEYAWDSDEASVYLRAGDACVLPLDYGVYLNNSSLAAAASHGLPIIATQGRTIEEPFVHDQNIFLCSPRNPKAMAAAIETLCNEPDLRRRLQLGALKLAQEWFSWERATDHTIATFR